MATIPANAPTAGVESYTISAVETTASDTLAQKSGRLVVRNASASPATINLVGDEATTAYDRGLGTIDVSGGYDLSVPAGDEVELDLNAISQYLAGTVTVTGGGTDIFAYIRG